MSKRYVLFAACGLDGSSMSQEVLTASSPLDVHLPRQQQVTSSVAKKTLVFLARCSSAQIVTFL